jgi:hypothetical protein
MEKSLREKDENPRVKKHMIKKLNSNGKLSIWNMA